MAGAGIYLEIDASDLLEELERLRNVFTPDEFNKRLYRVFARVPGHVRKILREDLPHQYHVKPSQVSAAVGGATMSGGAGGGVGCSIPITGPRGSIGGFYGASGGRHGWNTLKNGGGSIKGKIVKAGISTLPATLPSYGGQPPFRNLGSKLGGLTFTRAGKGRFPIMKVVGIAIPQMPTNRSEAEVQADILSYMAERIAHEFSVL